MNKIVLSCLAVSAVLFISAVSADNKKGETVNLPECCCGDCDCRDCRCDVGCFECRGCRNMYDCHQDCRVNDSITFYRHGYCCDYHYRADKRRYYRNHRSHHYARHYYGRCCDVYPSDYKDRGRYIQDDTSPYRYGRRGGCCGR